MEILKNIFKKLDKIHILGDSHTEVYKYVNFNKLGKLFKPKYCIVQGATASGLKNPHSKTNFKRVIDNYISENVSKNDFIVCHLGEVDCGFTIWYRSQKYNTSVTDQFNIAIDNYFSLIIKMKEIVGRKIFIQSVILPTISDGALQGDVANLRSSIKANQIEKTKITLSFSYELMRFCYKNNLNFIDLNPFLYDPSNKIVNSYFLNNDPKDHHLDNYKLSKVLELLLRKDLSVT